MTSLKWCIPRYARDQPANSGMRDAENDRDDADDGTVEPRCQQEEKPAVHGDGSGGMAGRVARVDRQALEPLHLGALALDDQRRRAVGRRLDGHDEHDERREDPAPHDQEGHETDPDDRGDHVPAGQRRPDPRDVLLRRGAIVGQPLAELDRPTSPSPPIGSSTWIRKRPRNTIAATSSAQPASSATMKTRTGIRRPEPPGEAVGEPVSARLEHRRDGARTASSRRGSRADDAGRRRLASRRPRHRVYPTDTRVKHSARSAPRTPMPFLVLLLISLSAGTLVAYVGSRYPTPCRRTTAPAEGRSRAHRDRDGAASVAAPARPRTARPRHRNRARAHACARSRDRGRTARRRLRVPRAHERDARRRGPRGRPVGRRPRDDAGRPTRSSWSPSSAARSTSSPPRCSSRAGRVPPRSEQVDAGLPRDRSWPARSSS